MMVLVIGGTGDLGAAVAQQLHGDGFQVRLLVRNRGRVPAPDSDFDYAYGDVDDSPSLQGALAGCDAVHVSVRGGPTAEQFDRVEHRGTARVAELAAREGVQRFTYVSHSLAASDAAAPDLRAKFHAEQAIATSGVPYTIFRPTYFMETLPRQIRGRRAVVLGRQRRPFHFLAAADFARMVSRSLSIPEVTWQAPGRPWSASLHHPGCVADLLRASGSWHPRRDDAAMVHDHSRSDRPSRRAPRHSRTDARP
jgi:uncharacterized protein YbjT (DUF2867 family)